MMQKTYNPVDSLVWTSDGWYEFDRKAAMTKARKDRDADAKRLKAEGYEVHKFSMLNQLITRGGIGTGHPEIENVVTVYGFNWCWNCLKQKGDA